MEVIMIYLFLADGFEEVEAITPVDYIRRCGLEISTVGVTGKKVKGAHGITIAADRTIDEFDPQSENDMIILPGGLDGTNNLRSNDKVIESIKNFNIKSSIAAICAAPSILGELNLLNGKKACCYPGFEYSLKGAQISFDAVVTDGNIITSRGAGTASQFSFAIIKYLLGKEKADEILHQVQWVC